MRQRLKSLLLALVMVISLGACKENKNSENESNDIATSLEESLEPIVEPEGGQSQEIISPDETICAWGIESETIQNELAKIEKGEPFQFTYVTREHETHSDYDLIGPLFKQIIVDGQKCLVYADDEENILISGYDYLGLPFYFWGYEEVYGGIDKDSDYAGWVIPVYNYGKVEDLDWQKENMAPPYITFDLYDYEDFRPLLKKCTPDAYFTNHGTDFLGIRGPLAPQYFEALDPAHGGCDEVNSASGYAVFIEKGSTTYLVDANDFTCIYFKDFVGLDSYNEGIMLRDYNGLGLDTFFKAEEITPQYSDALKRERIHR